MPNFSNFVLFLYVKLTAGFFTFPRSYSNWYTDVEDILMPCDIEWVRLFDRYLEAEKPAMRQLLIKISTLLFRWYGNISAKSISAEVHVRQITAPLNCVSAKKSLAHFTRSWQRSRGLRAYSAQFKKFKRFINDEVLYRATNKNHHRQPMLLRLLICRSIMTRRYSLHGLRGVRGLPHGQRQYVLICVIHVDFDVVSEVINDQATFCIVHVDLDV